VIVASVPVGTVVVAVTSVSTGAMVVIAPVPMGTMVIVASVSAGAMIAIAPVVLGAVVVDRLEEVLFLPPSNFLADHVQFCRLVGPAPGRTIERGRCGTLPTHPRGSARDYSREPGRPPSVGFSHSHERPPMCGLSCRSPCRAVPCSLGSARGIARRQDGPPCDDPPRRRRGVVANRSRALRLGIARRTLHKSCGNRDTGPATSEDHMGKTSAVICRKAPRARG